MNKNLLKFNVSIYGEMTKYNDVLSKARCRIFYKYGNRNGTYITDEFANKLLSSVAYTPVKGIYDGDDFTDHGEDNSEGKIYGIVPENPNVTWEKHVDEDGVEREYACVDVLIFSELYEEAKDIVSKAQSMELFRKTLKYHQAVIDGQKWFVFDDGCFFGLQVLGEDVEPCFEGAAFYSLKENIEKVIFELDKINNDLEEQTMKINFKLSHGEVFDAIWSLLNTEYNEENDWTVTYAILDVYDDYAFVYNYETSNYARVYYTKNDEDDSVVIDSIDGPRFMIDVSENELNTINTLRALNGDTYELVSDELTNAHDNFEKVVEFSTKIEELTAQNSTLTVEKDELAQANSSLQSERDSLAEENQELHTRCSSYEKSAKDAIVEQYVGQLAEEILDQYRQNYDNYSVVDLDKELAYQLKCANPSVFSKAPAYLPADQPLTGIEQILSKYDK